MSISVLIVGAGELGTAIVEGFAQHPAPDKGNHNASITRIAVMLRPESIDNANLAKKESNLYLNSLGADLVPGNFVEDPTSELAKTFGMFDVIIQAGGYGLPAGTQLKSAEAAVQAAVKHYFPWQFGMDYEVIGKGSSQELFDEMLEVRSLLRSQSRVGWTIISTGLFMSYLFLEDFQVVDFANKKVRALGSLENAITVTTPKDIGRMLAHVVLNIPEGDTLNQVVYIGGDTVRYIDLANRLAEALETDFECEEWKLARLRGRLETEPDNLWYKYQVIFGEARGVSWDQSKTLNGRYGIPMFDIEAYIAENKAAWVQRFHMLG